MNLQEICDLIDENYYKANNYYLSINEPEEFAKRVALEFGKQCFEAGYESGYDEAQGDGPLYETFEDYLKSLENGN